MYCKVDVHQPTQSVSTGFIFSQFKVQIRNSEKIDIVIAIKYCSIRSYNIAQLEVIILLN